MLSNLPKKVRIIEVGPRDGLQNEKMIVDIADKVTFIKMLSDAGLKDIEANSFVRADRIPQMSNGEELFKLLNKEESLKATNLISLVPNLKGMEQALLAGVSEIALFTATSNSFNQKNINCTIDESMARIDEVMAVIKNKKIKIRGYISTVFGCPYEGETSLETLDKLVAFFIKHNVYEISLGDTIGVANPLQVTNVLKFLKSKYDLNLFAMHFHDTRGMAIANILASLEMGMTRFDSSAAGLGGCPYAKGASGNVSTEDVVYLFESMGIKTGVDMQKLALASEFILSKLNKTTESKSLKAYLANRK